LEVFEVISGNIAGSTPCAFCEPIELAYESSSPAGACYSPEYNAGYKINNPAFASATQIFSSFSDCSGTPDVVSGYYSDGFYVRYWDNSSKTFTSIDFCFNYSPTPTPTPTPTSTPTPVPTLYPVNVYININNCTDICNEVEFPDTVYTDTGTLYAGATLYNSNGTTWSNPGVNRIGIGGSGNFCWNLSGATVTSPNTTC
jgi:hypothetical protein